MTTRIVFLVIAVIVSLFLGAAAYIVATTVTSFDLTAKAAIIGALTGTIGGISGAAITSLVNLWDRERESQERLKDRVSNHALELTRLDFEIRQKALENTGRRKKVLAPIKVYRELYKALLQLHKNDTWPSTINELGLLGIFETGAMEPKDDTQ